MTDASDDALRAELGRVVGQRDDAREALRRMVRSVPRSARRVWRDAPSDIRSELRDAVREAHRGRRAYRAMVEARREFAAGPTVSTGLRGPDDEGVFESIYRTTDGGYIAEAGYGADATYRRLSESEAAEWADRRSAS